MDYYKQRINRVIDYIENNLGKILTLDELAEISCFSRFHFNRLFTALMGETLFKFIQRLRIEKAASKLLYEKNKPIIDIALDHGFSSSASFAKCFKSNYGISPSSWRKNSNMRQVVSNKSKEFSYELKYTHYSKNRNEWSYVMNKNEIKVEVKEVEPMTVAYVRHVGPYAGDSELFGNLYKKLYKWAGSRGLINFPETKSISIYHDNSDITKEDKLRISICLTVPTDTEVSGYIGKMDIPGGLYAIGHFEIDAEKYQEAWNFICGEWLLNSGYEPDDRPCYELMLNNPEQHPEKKHIVDIYEPIKPIK